VAVTLPIPNIHHSYSGAHPGLQSGILNREASLSARTNTAFRFLSRATQQRTHTIGAFWLAVNATLNTRAKLEQAETMGTPWEQAEPGFHNIVIGSAGTALWQFVAD